MLEIEARLEARFPQWFRGRRAHVARPLVRGLQRWSRLDEIETFLAACTGLRDDAFLEAALDFLQVRYSVDHVERRRIPVCGRLLIVANHPSGAVDALALLHHVRSVRRDVRIVANDLLTMCANLESLLLPVRMLGGVPQASSLKAIEAALAEEQCVIVFPAGEVSRLGVGGIADGRWRRGFLRFARASGAPVLPVRIEARNSALFYGVSAVFRPAGTALLAREMMLRRARPVVLRIGEAMHLPEGVPPERAVREVRRALHRIGTRRETRPAPGPAPLAAAVEPALLRRHVAALALLGRTFDGKEIRAGRLAMGSPLLREVGRLREATFRAVGEGTLRALDLDVYDAWYEHIVLWDAAAQRVAGAYRVAHGGRVLEARGLAGLYTASLFDYAPAMQARIRQGVELGRSFMVQDYWGSRSIDYLWQGIGAWLARHPDVRWLFGSVSISAALPVAAREQIVAYYARYHGDGETHARPLNPFAYREAPPEFGPLDADTALGVLRANLAAQGAALPMLYRQYVDLCEPGGARFLAFGVDAAFSDAIDGLIELDLTRLKPRKRSRYLGQPAPGIAA
ncbi:lysophospholipid acyltransferase family protein [Coralloluteibacterium stylophorae]|uniref:L-ornithine N(alpha)-acyltransferase n=1 Tax=Coralloluteibacterium stylophorae TaxID=1776034 RepID=A0A8J8AYX5_9GAMM|nr:GNAT family N-acyltransferase [Coralloluteibacterium stylophorae]MBS7456041.1 lysophospholipid acyltransferase family protein [Coralloluteibacterium stylophorae]